MAQSKLSDVDASMFLDELLGFCMVPHHKSTGDGSANAASTITTGVTEKELPPVPLDHKSSNEEDCPSKQPDYSFESDDDSSYNRSLDTLPAVDPPQMNEHIVEKEQPKSTWATGHDQIPLWAMVVSIAVVAVIVDFIIMQHKH